MTLTFELSPGFKKLSIIVGFIAALATADELYRNYQAERAQLDFVCTYRYQAACGCSASDTTCVKKCETLKTSNLKLCTEDMKPSYYKLQDHFTWALLLWLPLAYCAGVAVVWLLARILKR